MFCCLPDQYGYWYKDLGQDAGGMCSPSSVLPEGSTPAIQVHLLKSWERRCFDIMQ